MSRDKGVWGEEVAREKLEEAGMEILETNWRAGHLEVDLIGREGDVLVFVEVKLRKWGGALEALHSLKEEQINRLARAAFCYMVEKEYDGEVRFDLVAITYFDPKNYKTRHVRDAFFPGSIL